VVAAAVLYVRRSNMRLSKLIYTPFGDQDEVDLREVFGDADSKAITSRQVPPLYSLRHIRIFYSFLFLFVCIVPFPRAPAPPSLYFFFFSPGRYIRFEDEQVM
jgi:hypothetical protein